MADNSEMGRVGNLEKEMEEVKIKLEKFTEMEKTMECLTQGFARILAALEDMSKTVHSTEKNIPAEKVNSESTSKENTPPEDAKAKEPVIIFQYTPSKKELKARKRVPTQAEVLSEMLMLDGPYVDLPSYPNLAPKEKLMRIKGTIKDKEVVVLIKSDASHNFVSEKLVKELGLPVSHTRDYIVVMDGLGVEGDRLCMYVTLEMPGVTAIEHFLPLEMAGGVDVILGSKWLRSSDGATIYLHDGLCRMKFKEGNDAVEWITDTSL